MSVLAGAALLGSLEPRLRDELVAIAEPMQLRAQEWLFLEGDVGDRLYVVLSGRLRVLAVATGTRSQAAFSSRTTMASGCCAC